MGRTGGSSKGRRALGRALVGVDRERLLHNPFRGRVRPRICHSELAPRFIGALPEMRRLTPHPAEREAWNLGLVYLEPVERRRQSLTNDAPCATAWRSAPLTCAPGAEAAPPHRDTSLPRRISLRLPICAICVNLSYIAVRGCAAQPRQRRRICGLNPIRVHPRCHTRSPLTAPAIPDQSLTSLGVFVPLWFQIPYTRRSPHATRLP